MCKIPAQQIFQHTNPLLFGYINTVKPFSMIEMDIYKLLNYVRFTNEENKENFYIITVLDIFSRMTGSTKIRKIRGRDIINILI